MNATTQFMDETFRYVCTELMEHYVPDYFKGFEYTPWIFSLLGSALIGLSGILPMFIIPLDAGVANKGSTSDKGNVDPAESKSLKVLLSFAVGGLLGDVFLHLLPEAWRGESDIPSQKDHPSMRNGLWVLAGILIFTIVEKIFSGYANADEENPQPKCVEIATCLMRRNNGKIPDGQQSCVQNGSCDIEDVPNGCYLAERERKKEKEGPTIKIAGYLNLLANSIDNFTHGLAVAGSFLISFRHGVLGTFAILLHEIPHEFGDFAILLKSGFTRWDAAKAQILTAGAGILGALVAIGGTEVSSAMEARTLWITPFTAGGFLHIALVTVLPDLIKEDDPVESFKQLAALLAGIGLMAFMTIIFES